MSNRKLTLDLHDIYNDKQSIDQALNSIIDEAEEIGAKRVEIIHGKGSGQLKKRVLQFLNQKSIKSRYHRLDKDKDNHGRLFVIFK